MKFTIPGVPRRIFLDSCTVQTIYDYGDFIFDNTFPDFTCPVFRDQKGEKKLIALRNVVSVFLRSTIEVVVSKNTLKEVNNKRDWGLSSYLFELYHFSQSTTHIDVYTATAADWNSLGYLDEGDRRQLGEAHSLKCDTFLTFENKLPKNAKHLRRQLGIDVQTPTELWSRLKPWSALLY